MLVRADLVHQFAGHLERVWREAGHADVVVRADIRKSLNGRPPQPFVDPEVDLTSVDVNHFASDPWVVSLQVPAWGVSSDN